MCTFCEGGSVLLSRLEPGAGRGERGQGVLLDNIPGWAETAIKKAVQLPGRCCLHPQQWLGSAGTPLGISTQHNFFKQWADALARPPALFLQQGNE